jgi:hypothetical protein
VLCYEVIYRHLLAAFHNLSTFQQEQLIAATFISAYLSLSSTNSIFISSYAPSLDAFISQAAYSSHLKQVMDQLSPTQQIFLEQSFS